MVVILIAENTVVDSCLKLDKILNNNFTLNDNDSFVCLSRVIQVHLCCRQDRVVDNHRHVSLQALWFVCICDTFDFLGQA